MGRLLERLRAATAVQPGEGGVVALAGAALFLVEWAAAAVSNAADAMFLKRVGIAWMPVVLLGSSLLLALSTLLVGRFASRVEHARLLRVTYAALALLLGLLWVLVATGAPASATLLVLASKQVQAVALFVLWLAVGARLSGRQAKRLVAPMTAGGTLGSIVGSFTSGPLAAAVGVPALLPAAAVALSAAAVAASTAIARASARIAPTPACSPEAREERVRLRRLWAGSSLFRALFTASFLAGVVGPVLHYEFSAAADLATRTADGEQRLLALYGAMRGWVNVGVLALQLVGTARLFQRLGVPLASMLAPAAWAAAFAGLGASPSLAVAMPASVATGVLDRTVQDPSQRILAGLLPRDGRTAASGLVSGPAKRAGAALGCALLLLAIDRGGPSAVALVGAVAAAGWFGVSLFLWRAYPRLLLESASVRDGEAQVATLLDVATLRALEPRLAGDDAAGAAAACALFREAPPAAALESVARSLLAAGPASRPALVDTVALLLDRLAPDEAVDDAVVDDLARAAAADSGCSVEQRAILVHAVARLGGERASTLLVPVAADDRGGAGLAARLALARRRGDDDGFDAVVAAALEAAVEDIAHGAGEAVGEAAGDAAVDAAGAAVRAAAGAAAGESAPRFGSPAGGAPTDDGLAGARAALRELRCSLRAEEPDGAAAWRRRWNTLLSAAEGRSARGGDRPGEPSIHPAGHLRAGLTAAAAAALADVAARHGAACAADADRVLALADDDDERVRAAVLLYAGRCGLADRSLLLAARLSSPSDAEHAAAAEALETLGAAAADGLLLAMRDGRRRARARAAAILRETALDEGTLSALVERDLAACRELSMLHGVLGAAQPGGLVAQRMRERVDERLRVLLDLVAALLGDSRIVAIRRGLGRSWTPRDRAVLLEALEALLPASLAADVLPLLEPGDPSRAAGQAARRLGRTVPDLAEAVAAAAHGDPFTAALLVASADSGPLRGAVARLDAGPAPRILARRGRSAAAAAAPTAAAADGAKPGSTPLHRAGPMPAEDLPMLNPVDTMLLLKNLDLFEGLTTRQLAELAAVVRETVVADGGAIVAEGEFADSMYFLVEGRVRIAKEGRTVAELGPRDFLGEMAVFDGERRSATATAVGECRLLQLARGDLFDVMEDEPGIAIGICQTLVRRLRGLLDTSSRA